MYRSLGFIEDDMLKSVPEYYSVYTEHNIKLNSISSDYMSTSQSQTL